MNGHDGGSDRAFLPPPPSSLAHSCSPPRSKLPPDLSALWMLRSVRPCVQWVPHLLQRRECRRHRRREHRSCSRPRGSLTSIRLWASPTRSQPWPRAMSSSSTLRKGRCNILYCSYTTDVMSLTDVLEKRSADRLCSWTKINVKREQSPDCHEFRSRHQHAGCERLPAVHTLAFAHI